MPRNSRLIILAGALWILTLASGCATLPAGAVKDPRDPLERVNRTMFKVDDVLAHHVAIPVGHAYTKVTPTFVRRGIAHVFENAHTPAVMVNDLLQAKFSAFGQQSARFVLNSTIGLAGLLDPATGAGIPKDDNDFGRTLGTWGVPPGPYLVLPLFGPSDIRDTTGRVADAYLGPLQYIGRLPVRYGLYGLEIINDTTETIIPIYRLLDQENVFDRYAFARNAFLQQRDFQIRGDKGPAVDQEELDLQKSLQDDSAPDSK
ncbi:MAG TPA: VacJ family lipoprotein [Steroidobacteraceae bacterium]|jgi:phospholipid-binding lipoprotein MlaA